MAGFVHLHVHSDYSLLDGASSVKALVARAKALGMGSLAITDHGNLFGALKFYKECKEQGLKPLVGIECYVAGGSRLEKSGTEFGNKYYHLVLIAKNVEGWRNLIELSSAAYTEGFYYKPRVDEELLERHRGGLLCASACVAGRVPQLILAGKLDEARALAGRYRELFGPDGFFLELQDHGIPEQKVVNEGLIELARRDGHRLIASNDAHYAEKADAAAQDILLCIGTNAKKNEPGRMSFYNDQFYLKSEEEMRALFPDFPEALSNTLLAAEQCDLEIPQPGPLLPDYEIPQDFPSPDAYLRHLSYEGAKERYGQLDEAKRERLDYELDTIIKMGFTGYFLIVWDFIHYAKSQGIPVGPGRGSGAGSIVAYSLKITDIDPLRYELLFERFLNPERVSMPDFDIDFCFERRQEVIDYVTRRYGADRVGQIITFGTLKAKAVIKDVARALDISFEDANRIAKLIPEDPKMTLAKAFELEPKLKEIAAEPRYKELFEIAAKLENKNRHSSLHAAGVVIGKTKLTDYVPLFYDPKAGMAATQFTMEQIESCGLVKMDFLGLKTLTLIEHTLALLKKRGIELAAKDIPDDDKATFDMLAEGKSTCIFQFESSGMQGVLKKAKPTRIEDLIALNALYRPGPMDNIDQFVDCKWGRREIEYPHESLKPILEETYGVIVYQEQVMQAVQILAGYSLGQADLLRRAMGKKKVEEMAKQRAAFVEGCARKHCIEAKRAGEIFDLLEKFAGYGFNKSHAAAYSVLAYQTAYLKANYPAEFMAANLTNEINNQDKLQEYIIETRKMGIAIDPPDVNRSDKKFAVVDGRIVYGLLGIKGLGEGAVEAIIAEREAKGPFKDLTDFMERVDNRGLNRKALEVLISAGCFDGLGQNRATLMRNLERAIDYVQAKRASRQYGQNSLFDDTGVEEFPPFDWEEMLDWPKLQALEAEKELLGFYFSGHPMDEWRKTWERCVDLDLAHPERAMPDRPYTVLGMVKGVRQIQTKAGKQMMFASIDDFNGSIELVFFPEAFERCRDGLKEGAVVALSGKVEKNRGEPKFIVEGLVDTGALKEKAVRELHIELAHAELSETAVTRLKDLVLEHHGACSLFIHFPGPEGIIVKANSQVQVAATDRAMESLIESGLVAHAWKE
jgi:DNA polymerase-3 subunit alpha